MEGLISIWCIVTAILLVCITFVLFRISSSLEAIYSVMKRTSTNDKK